MVPFRGSSARTHGRSRERVRAKVAPQVPNGPCNNERAMSTTHRGTVVRKWIFPVRQSDRDPHGGHQVMISDGLAGALCVSRRDTSIPHVKCSIK